MYARRAALPRARVILFLSSQPKPQLKYFKSQACLANSIASSSTPLSSRTVVLSKPFEVSRDEQGEDPRETHSPVLRLRWQRRKVGCT